MDKRWVFTELVKNKDDFEGLLAYSFYKVDKNAYAEELKAQNLTPEQIDEKVHTFHDMALRASAIEGYRKNAVSFMHIILKNMEEEVGRDFQQQINKLKKQVQDKDKKHASELAKAKRLGVESFYDTYCTGNKEGKSKWLLSALWLWNGFSGVFAAIIVAVVVYGIAAQFVSSDKRNDILNSAADNIKSALVPSSPIPEVKLPPLPNSKS